MTALELKPCPFCGRGAEFSLGKTGDGKDWHYTECVNCGATGPLVNYADHNIAINDALADAWNRRADLAAVQPAQVLETCGKCMGSGYGGHPDSGQLCADCNGNGGVEPQPDPRDEVIKGLVEAATNAAEAIDMAYGSDDDESPHRHSAKLRAALAAAKAVQHG